MITLRLDKNGGINKGDIKAFEHDNLSEVYVIQLYKNGAIYDLTNKTVELTIVEKKRKLGDMISLPIYEATEGKVKLEVVSTITKQDGIFDFKLTVKDTTGLIETFPNFQVKIENDITDHITGEIVQDKNFTILTEGLKALADYNIYKTNALKVPEIEQDIIEINSQLDTKANKNEVGTPLVANSISEMIDTTKVYVNTTDGNWYSWNGDNWNVGGVYNSQAIASESIKGSMLYKGDVENYNMINLSEVTEKGYIPSYNSDKTITVTNGGHTNVLKYEIKVNDKKIVSQKPPTEYLWGATFVLVDNENKYTLYGGVLNESTPATYPFISFEASSLIYEIDVVEMLKVFPTTTHIYVVYKDYIPKVQCAKYYDITEFKWLKNERQEKIEKYFNISDIVLPSKVFGLQNHETNIYLKNILKNKYNIEALNVNKYDYSECLTDRIILNPTSSLINDLKFSLYQNDLENLSFQKTVTFISTDETAGSGVKKVLIIGDSKVEGGFISHTLKELMDSDVNMSIELLGTKYSWSEENRHEGRGGWAAETYCTQPAYNGKTNPFFNNDTFDFTYYMDSQGYNSVDYVFFNVGTNDVAKLSSDGIDTIIGYYNKIVSSIKSFDSNIKVIIGMCEGVYRFSNRNTSSNIKWDLNKSITLLHEALINNYDNRESEKIFLCPMYINMDLENDYNFEEVPLSSRDVLKTRMKCVDPIHQSKIGYQKCADMMYYTLKYIESLN